MGEGGAAPGGRPKELQNPTQLTIKLERAQLDRLEQLARDRKTDRLKLIREAIDLLVPPPEKKI